MSKALVAVSVYEALAHPIREKIIRILGREKPLTYTELMEQVGVTETGKFNYHLEKVAAYLDRQGGLYTLNEKGRRLFNLLQTNDTILFGKRVESAGTGVERKIVRIGVVLCTCGETINRTVRTEDLAKNISQLNSVVSTGIVPNLCTPASVENLMKWCKKNFINQLVIGACSPRLHKTIFAEIQESLGIPIEVANIMEQCAWVHKNAPSQATEKARVLIEAMVQVATIKNYGPKKSVNVRKQVAVIGGGPAGLTVAEYVSRAGFNVYVIERRPLLGGKLAYLSHIQGVGDCASCMMAELTSEVIIGKNTKILTDTELRSISGHIGDFKLVLEQVPRFVDPAKCTACGACVPVCPRNRKRGLRTEQGTKIIHLPSSVAYPMAYHIHPEDIEKCRECRRCESACRTKAIELEAKPKTTEIEVGAVVFATGAETYEGQHLTRLGYGLSRNIITSEQFEQMITPEGPTKGRIIRPSDGRIPKTIAIVQCVNDGPCQRFCCNVAKKYVERINQKLKGCETILVYDERNVGVSFFKDASRVVATADPRINVKEGKLLVTSGSTEIEADLVVLNIGFVPSGDLQILHRMIELAVDDWGFIRPDSLPSGIMACGAVTGPKTYDALQSESKSVALDVITLLCKDLLTVSALKIQVNLERCGLCGLCVQACAFKAIAISEDAVHVDEFKCKECGACVPLCPTGAIESAQTYQETIRTIDAFSAYKAHPRILAFCCESCGYAAADSAGIKGIDYSPNVLIARVNCAGRVDSDFIVHALQRGFNGVLIAACRENSCKYLGGTVKAKRKVDVLRRFYGPQIDDKVRVQELSALEGSMFAQSVDLFVKDLWRGETHKQT